MALPVKPNLGELRSELLVRLGFVSQGAGAGAAVPVVDSILKRAQTYLYWKYDFNELRQTYDWAVQVGQTLYDWPDEMEPRQLIQLRVLYNGDWQPLDEGIEFQHDTVVTTRYYPRRYDRRAQLEIWPQPDNAYTLRGEHYKRLAPFTQQQHRCTIDDNILFAYSLGQGKLHYRQNDAQTFIDEAADLLLTLKGAAHGQKRYRMGNPQQTSTPRPVVVDYKN